MSTEYTALSGVVILTPARFGKHCGVLSESWSRNIDLVRMICASLDQECPKETPDAEQITFVTDRPGHDLRDAIDPTFIASELG